MLTPHLKTIKRVISENKQENSSFKKDFNSLLLLADSPDGLFDLLNLSAKKAKLYKKIESNFINIVDMSTEKAKVLDFSILLNSLSKSSIRQELFKSSEKSNLTITANILMKSDYCPTTRSLKLTKLREDLSQIDKNLELYKEKKKSLTPNCLGRFNELKEHFGL